MISDMQNYFYLNIEKMVELSRDMDGSEIKMLLGICYRLNTSNSRLFVNNALNREALAKLGLAMAPSRFCAVLGSMVKKGILKREANGVYSLLDDLCIIP